MAHDKATKDSVRKMYIFDHLSLDNAARLAGISYATAQRWKRTALVNGDDWDKQQSAQTLSGGTPESVARQILAGVLIMYQSTMEQVQSGDLSAHERVSLLASLADSYNKAISANKKMLPETSKLANALETIELLAEHIKETKPELLSVFLEVLEPFGEKIQKQFGNTK